MTKRIFAGIPIPFSGNIQNWYEFTVTHFKDEKIKWVDPENMHLTLHFIGNTGEHRACAIAKKLERVGTTISPFEICFSGVGLFKSVSNPKVLFFDIKDSMPLRKLKRKIDQVLMEFSPEGMDPEKHFHPHLTIGRPKFIKEKNRLAGFIQDHRHADIEKSRIREFVLFESTLHKSGPVYTRLQSYEFRGEGNF